VQTLNTLNIGNGQSGVGKQLPVKRVRHSVLHCFFPQTDFLLSSMTRGLLITVSTKTCWSGAIVKVPFTVKIRLLLIASPRQYSVLMPMERLGHSYTYAIRGSTIATG